MKCKHPKNGIFYRWVTMYGLPISFLAGADQVKKEYTCMQCGKTFIKTPSCIES
jgi:hypothetical protein